MYIVTAEYFVYHTMSLLFVKATRFVYLSGFARFVSCYLPLPRSHCTTWHVVCPT